MSEIVVRTPAGASPAASVALQKMISNNPLDRVGVSCLEGFMARLDMMIVSSKYQGLSWNNIDLDRFMLDCFAMAKLGLNPLVNNLVHVVPFKDKKSGRYSASLIIGYKGLELVARKFGVDCPNGIRVELVYRNDQFETTAASSGKGFDFVHKMSNPFDRGDVVGGYAVFERDGGNTVHIMSLDDMMKRKPLYASPEFWGGEKEEWMNGSRTGKKVRCDGWLVEMLSKTLLRWAWGKVTLDPEKIAIGGEDVARILSEEPAVRDGMRLEQESGDNREALLRAMESSKSSHRPTAEPDADPVQPPIEQARVEEGQLSKWQAEFKTKRDNVFHLKNWWKKNKEQARSELGGKFDYFDIEVDATINDMTPEEPPLPEPPPHLR